MNVCIYAVILSMLCFVSAQAQDKIFKVDGSEIKAKIIEIDADIVKYQEEGESSGPIRHINSGDIFMVIYGNGKREYFDKHQIAQPVTSILPPIELPAYELLPNLMPPPTGQAAIYFFRPSIVGYAVPFDIYKGDRMIIALKVKNYERYVCPPGTYHFIAANMGDDSFLTAHLRQGGIYFVRLNGLNGDMEPITINHKDFQDLLKLVNKKEPFISGEERLEKQVNTYSRLIEEKKTRLDGLLQHGMTRNIPVLEADMAIPYELLRK